ncbi:alkane 1-monooxygenase, partial [Mycobacterium tuberculosis]
PAPPPARPLSAAPRWALAVLALAAPLGSVAAWVGAPFPVPWAPLCAPALLLAPALLRPPPLPLAPGAPLL